MLAKQNSGKIPWTSKVPLETQRKFIGESNKNMIWDVGRTSKLQEHPDEWLRGIKCICKLHMKAKQISIKYL